MKWLSSSADLSPCDFFLWSMWRDWSMSPFFLLALNLSSAELILCLMLPKTYYSVFGKSLTIDKWCTYWTHKLFNFIEQDQVVFKIIAFKMSSFFVFFFGGDTLYVLYINLICHLITPKGWYAIKCNQTKPAKKMISALTNPAELNMPLN